MRTQLRALSPPDGKELILLRIRIILQSLILEQIIIFFFLFALWYYNLSYRGTRSQRLPKALS